MNNQVLIWEAVLILWLLGSVWVLIRAQRRRAGFDLSDLITGDNGLVSLSKFAQCGAFAASTWVFVYLSITSGLTEWYYGAYMVAWAGANLVNKWLSKDATIQPQQNVSIKTAGVDVDVKSAAA